MPGPGIEPEPFGWEAEALPLSYIPLFWAEESERNKQESKDILFGKIIKEHNSSHLQI